MVRNIGIPLPGTDGEPIATDARLWARANVVRSMRVAARWTVNRATAHCTISVQARPTQCSRESVPGGNVSGHAAAAYWHSFTALCCTTADANVVSVSISSDHPSL